MDDAYGKNSGKENECFGGWYGNRKKRSHFEDLVIGGMILLNVFAKK